MLHRLQHAGVRVWLLIWDNASWHVSKRVRAWIRAHNRTVKRGGAGVRILPCYLPVKSPWLNPIEPKWVHGKRAIVEPTRLLSAQETLVTLARDTGGRAFTDSNDLSLAMKQAQVDTNVYYVLGYFTSNPKEDGKYRKIRVRTTPPAGMTKINVRAREGYYGAGN